MENLNIHPTAIIGKNVNFGSNVTIGPYSIIQNNVNIGSNSKIGNYVTVCNYTKIGESCSIFHNSSVGEIPQDLKFDQEKTETIIGNGVTVREYVTINRGTKALGKTVIGDNCLLMAYVHIGHDCILGDNVVLANMATLGGHVSIDNNSSLGGGVLVHQFCKIGIHVFVGGGFRVVQDIPPFILAAKEPLKYQGINLVGLKRSSFDQKTRQKIKNIYKIIYRSDLNTSEAIKTIKRDFESSREKVQILEFIKNSKRGII